MGAGLSAIAKALYTEAPPETSRFLEPTTAKSFPVVPIQLNEMDLRLDAIVRR